MTQTTSKPSTGQTDKKKKAKRSATDKQSAKELERLNNLVPAQEFEDLESDDVPNGLWGKIHLMVDLESRHVGLSEMKSGLVGHTWVSIEPEPMGRMPKGIPGKHQNLLRNGGKYADSFGFWPDLQGELGTAAGYSQNPFKSYIQGIVRNPDTAHEGAEKATMTYPVTLAQAQNALKYADSKRTAKYSVYHYNCTGFAKGFVEAAGQSAPDVSKGGIAMPDSAYNGILKWAKKGKEGAEVEGGVDDNEAYVNEADIGVTWEQSAVPKELKDRIDKPNFLKVKSVRKGGPAEGHLNVGDRVAWIDGNRCNSTMTVKRALFAAFDKEIEFSVIDGATFANYLKDMKGAGEDEEAKDQVFENYKGTWFNDVMVKAGRPHGTGKKDKGKKDKTD